MSNGHERQQRDLGFSAIYFDTEPLRRSNWPDQSVILRNVFTVANRWGLDILIPEPVERQTEEQWLRNVRSRSTKLESAAKDMNRFISPVGTNARTEHENLDVLLARYREAVGRIKQRFTIRTSPFTMRSSQEFFNRAIRYILPFESKGEGKGFQDAVILASVLDDLIAHPDRSAVLVSADEVFSKTDLSAFLPGCPSTRLKFLTLDEIWEILWEKYWDENVKVPWEEEQRNAMEAVRQMEADLKIFLESQLTETILSVGTFQKVMEFRGVNRLEIQYIQTPLPMLGAALDRNVRFAIALFANCRGLIEESYAPTPWLFSPHSELPPPPPPPRQRETELFWMGGIEAQADVVNRRFANIRLLALVSSQELGDQKWWKQHPPTVQNQENQAEPQG